MPPPPGLYNSTFTVGSVVAGFDIRTNGYSNIVEANQTVEPIPWAQSYSVVRQSGGLLPHKRQYRAIVYTEDDLITLALQVSMVGSLATPREGAVQAALDRIERGPDTDPSDPDGQTVIQVSFTILQ
jgi:hypothetical protein